MDKTNLILKIDILYIISSGKPNPTWHSAFNSDKRVVSQKLDI